MSRIICGRFDRTVDADAALENGPRGIYTGAYMVGGTAGIDQ